MADFEKNIEMEKIFAPFIPDEDHYIFVSYSHADRERVFPIITRLYEQGWHIWYDQGIELGENYYVELAQHIKNCDVFLLFISNNAVKSEFVSNQEVLYACNRSKLIVQCKLDVDAVFPVETSDALDLATASRRHPNTDETGLEATLLTIPGLQRFQARKAVGYQLRIRMIDVPVVTDKDEYEFVKCSGGIRLGKYLGKDEDVIIPAVYKGYPVIEMESTFWGNNSIRSVHIPEGVKRLLNCFLCDNLSDVFLPASINRTEENKQNLFHLYLTQGVTVHGVFGSDVHYMIKELQIKYASDSRFAQDYASAFVPDYSISSSVVSSTNKPLYVYCSYAAANVEEIGPIISHIRKHGFLVEDSSTLSEREKLERFRKSAIFLAFVTQAYLETAEYQLLNLSLELKKKCFLWVLEECLLPIEISLAIENEQQIRYDNGTKKEQIAKLESALRKSGCYRPSEMLSDFEFNADTEGITLLRYVGSDADVTIPKEVSGIPVVRIGEDAFHNGWNTIKHISLPASISEVNAYSFLAPVVKSSLLESITVEIDNQYYKTSGNDCLLSRDGKRLVFHPPMAINSRTQCVVPDGVSIIGAYAFYQNRSIKMITLPQSLNIIGNSAFKECDCLLEIVVPDNVMKIENAFDKHTTVICSRDSYAWGYCESNGIPHSTPEGDDLNTDLQNDFEDIFKLFE